MHRGEGFSWITFFIMSVIFLGSVAMFFVLIRRWTLHSRWTAMSEWARERGFRHLLDGRALPGPLEELELLPQLAVSSGQITIVDFSPVMSEDQAAIHVLHRSLDWPLAAGGLRQLTPLSLIDRFKLTPFPLITGNERFTAVGADSAAARQIADAMRAYLPADLGLLVIGRSMLIEFSSRRFDTIEFDRLIALSDQLMTKIPQPSSQTQAQV